MRAKDFTVRASARAIIGFALAVVTVPGGAGAHGPQPGPAAQPSAVDRPPAMARAAVRPPDSLRTYATRHFALHTDTDVEFATHLSGYLDAYHDAISRHIRTIFGVDVPMPRTSIMLFERQSSYQAFALDNAPQLTNNGGYYDGGSRTIVSYRFNNSMQLYFHEIVHALMGELFADHHFFRYTRANWPVWFDEGLAEYLGSFAIEGRTIRVGVRNPTKVAYLLNAQSSGTQIALTELLSAPADRFSGAEMNIFYAASWGLLTWLTEHPVHRERLPVFLAELRRSGDGLLAFSAAFGHDMAILEADFRKWVSGLAQPPEASRLLFDGTTIDDWTIHEGGSWRVRQGEIVALGEDGYNYLIRSELPRHAFRLSLQLRLDGGSVGVILGNNFHAEYPYYYLVDMSADRVAVRRSHSPTRIDLLASAPSKLKAPRWVSLDIIVHSDRLQLYVDGQKTLDVPEDRDQYSLFGLYLHRGRARFRDIELASGPHTLLPAQKPTRSPWLPAGPSSPPVP